MKNAGKVLYGWIIQLKPKHSCHRLGAGFYCGAAGDHIVDGAFCRFGYSGPLDQAAVWNTRADARRAKNRDEVVRRVLLDKNKRPMYVNGRG